MLMYLCYSRSAILDIIYYLNVNNICVNLPSNFESNSSRIFENGLLSSNSVFFSAKYYPQSSYYTSFIKGTPSRPRQVSPEWRLSWSLQIINQQIIHFSLIVPQSVLQSLLQAARKCKKNMT